jgi:electron transfer flavoprotein beta subunit
MKIIACCKAVQEEQEIVIRANGELSFEQASWKISQYDLNAIEAGKALAQDGGQLIGLSVGGNALESTKLRKDLLSRGLDELFLVMDEGHPYDDTFQTAAALKAAVEEIGDYDLVLCGIGSGDLYAQEVGNVLGAMLGVSVMNDVSKITPAQGAVIVERCIGNVVEELEIGLPAVLSVTADINTPSIPGMRDIMKAGKKPVEAVDVSVGIPEEKAEILSQLAPPQKGRANHIIEGDDDEAVDALVDFLKKEMA